MKKKVLLYITIFILCFLFASVSSEYDYDLFARLIVGERFIENGILPFKDFLSYTPTHAWYDHEWGSGVVFYLLLKYLGPFGFILMQALLSFGTAFFVIKTQRVQRGGYPASILFMSVFVVLFSSLNPSLIRCQMFSFFFFAMFLYLLEKNRQKETKWIWLIVPVTVIWNNLHGGILAGLGFVFLYFIGALAEKRPWKKLASILALSSFGLLINPWGYKYLPFLFSAGTMHRKYITEWWPFYHKRHFWYYFPIAAFLIFTALVNFIQALRQKKFDITKSLTIIVTLYMGLAHVKLLSLPLIALSALCYNDIVKLFRFLKKGFIYFNILACAAILISAILFIPFKGLNIPKAQGYKFPYYETEFIKINDIKGNIVVPFGFGSYVSYKLYPNNLIYMDGRYEEVYNNKEYYVLRDYELAEPNWQDIVKNYPTDILMPLKYTEIYPVLLNNPDWKQIYEGVSCGVFVKKEAAKSNYLEPAYIKNYYRLTMFKNKGVFKNK